MNNELLSKLCLPADISEMLEKCPSFIFAHSKQELFELSTCNEKNGWHKVGYEVKGRGMVEEAHVCRVKNGISVNYLEAYMRRREPQCMVIGDDLPTDKITYKKKFGKEFSELRGETIRWLTGQKLACFAFSAGNLPIGVNGFAVVPANAGFFALSLALLQGIKDLRSQTEGFPVNCLLFAAPPFRHTHFNGKQLVVHNRTEKTHEIFSYNLYPGPSAKKGVYAALLDFGEKESWVTAHASVVQIITPYDNKICIMHEGASGSGKSEMHEHLHREYDGTITFGENTASGEKRSLVFSRTCDIRPVADDMALCHPNFQKNNGKLTAFDAESAWFIRVDHIKNYGTDPDIEARSIHPPEPIVFLNIDAQPGSSALLWEHTEDSPGKACPNPRFIFPRHTVPGIVEKPVSIDLRSFGLRTPPSSRENPDYGILGIFHVLPPAVAWLWRLVSPRGYQNPSVLESGSMESEGVGSYWPFATGKKTRQASLLLAQFESSPRVHYVLCPNQHIGIWKTGFMPQWIMREYLARRGGVKFSREELSPARCLLLGYALNKLMVEGQIFDKHFLKTECQPEMGTEAYDQGAEILFSFFRRELADFNNPDLCSSGRKIIECFFDHGKLEQMDSLLPGESIFLDE